MGLWKGTIDNFNQDQDSPLFQFYLMTHVKDDITLTSNVARGDLIIPVSTGHGFSVGDYIAIFDVGGNYTQQYVVSVTVDNIGIGAPVANGFSMATSKIVRGKINQAVDGSVTPVEYIFRPYNFIQPIDISYVKLTMLHNTEGDYTTFGDIAELDSDKGYYLRKENDKYFSLGNYKKNFDFEEFGADVSSKEKTGGGQWSTTIIWDIKKIFGQVIRLYHINPDTIKATVRANLTDGATLTNMRLSLLGSFTVGE